MADELGTAVLKITVDDGPARQKLKELREEIEKGGTGVGSSRRSGANTAATKAERDLEIIKEKRFRLARRIDALEEKGVSTARLRTQLGRLTTAYAQRDFDLARKYARELARAATLEEQRTRSAARRRQVEERDFTRGPARRLDRTPLQGSVREVGSPRFVNNAIRQGGPSESRDALFNAQKRRYSLDQQIRSLEAAGVNTDKLRVELGRVTEAQARRRFGTAKQLGEQLDFQLRKERDILNTRLNADRATTRQTRAAEAEGRRLGRLNASPVTGGAAFPGSPAFIQAAADRRRQVEKAWDLALRQLGETAETIRKNAIEEGRRIGSLNTSPVRGGAGLPGSPAFLDAQFPAFPKGFKGLTLDQQAARDRVSERRAQNRASQTAGGSGLGAFLREQRLREEGERKIAAIRKAGYKDAEFAEKTLRSFVEQRAKRESGGGAGLRKRAGGAVGSALIGGGFPLLFGQGVGAAAGGLAGGAVGGAIGGQFGFGLSIVGTIIGDAFDEALNKGKTLAAGLSDPIGKFEELRQAGLISSKALEKNVASLIAQGREAEAAAQIQLDLATSFGDTSELTALNNAYDELGRAFSQLSVITAKFVAGPLADFINKLAASFKVFSARALFEERLQGASPEVQAAARQQVRQRAGALSGSGLSLSEVGTEAYAAGLTFLDERLGKTKEVQRAEAAIVAATARQNAIRSLSFRQIDAQVQGYDRLNLELEKQRIEQQRLQDLSVPKADADKINTEAAQATYRVQSQINDLAKERVAIATEEAAKYQLAGEKLKQELQAVQALSALSQNAQRTAQFAVQQSTLGTIQGIGASVGQAQRREREIGAQIDAARLRGGDAGEQEAARLVNEQKLAAAQTRLELETGSRALTEAGIKLREDVDAAFLNLQKLRTGTGGLNQFLTAQDRVNQERRTFEQLLPSFREAQAQFRQLRGVNYAPEFTGTTAGINQSILQFIDAVRTEQQAVDNSVDTQRALNENTAALAQITGELRTTIAELNTKNWNVSVNVAADGTSQATGDVVNNFLSVPS